MLKNKIQNPKLLFLRLIIPFALVAVWAGFSAIGGPYFGKIDEVATNDFATFLPESAESTKAKSELEKFQNADTIPAIAVFESDTVLTAGQKDILENVAEVIDKSNLANSKVSAPIVSDDEKAAYIIIPVASESEFEQLFTNIKAKIDTVNTGIKYSFTGPAMFSQELDKAFAGIDGTLLFVALGVVLVILLFVYRSPILPLVTLMGAMMALSGAIFVVWHLANAGYVQLNGQVQGILFILVIGAATDYALLYIARYREELTHHDSSLQATRAAWRASLEPIIAAGGTVTLGLLCLLASDLGSNKALGPVGGIGILFSVLSALTFLPAALLLFGRISFWPLVPKFIPNKKQTDYRGAHPVWAKVGQFVGRRPRRIWIGVTTVLIMFCFAVSGLDASGVSQENLVLGPSEAKDGQAIIDRHFPAGSGSPASIIIPAEEQGDVVRILDNNKGVNGVFVLTTDKEKSQMPVGKEKALLLKDIRDEVKVERSKQLNAIKSKIYSQMKGLPRAYINKAYEQASSQVPSVQTLVDDIYPFTETKEKVVDGRIVVMATLTDAASSVEARQTIERLRSEIKHNHPMAVVGGVSAIQLDTNAASEHDLKVIIPLILGAITIVLMLLLRAIVAPILLLLTTVLSFGATLGVAALLFNYVWHFPGADPVVIIFGFVFLVALGIDYNIFLMTRVREETTKLGVRRGTLKALVVTGGVITSAGIVLASTFAALNVIPILFLAQISFIVAFGVILDTLVVRSLLVPALTLEMSRLMWWPSKLWKTGKK